jgi:hypothetical protein
MVEKQGVDDTLRMVPHECEPAIFVALTLGHESRQLFNELCAIMHSGDESKDDEDDWVEIRDKLIKSELVRGEKAVSLAYTWTEVDGLILTRYANGDNNQCHS